MSYLKIKYTSQNDYQQEIDRFWWSLKIIEAFDNGDLKKEEIDKLNDMGFNWGYARQKLMDQFK